MEFSIIDGFKFIRTKDSIEDLLVESDKISETIECINRKKISINNAHGYFLENIEFVCEIADTVEGLNIVQGNIDIHNIECLHNLKLLYLADIKYPLDFSSFKNLSTCNISWNKEYKNLNTCKKLRKLGLWKFPYNEKTADFLIGLEELESLEFVQSKFADLEFLQHFPKLRTLELYYISILENIDGLKYNANFLQRLILDHCKRIGNYDVLSQLKELKWLNVTDSREFENLVFLKKLPKLEHFAFVNTNVVNGDLSPTIGVKYVGFNNKRHFSHTNEEIHKLNNNAFK